MSRKFGCDTMPCAMDITYLGHSSFKLRGKDASLVTDPFAVQVGFSFPKTSADIVTVSHKHEDHGAFISVSGTIRREKPFVVEYPGEYEISGVSIFGVSAFHDLTEGAERGENIIYLIRMDGVNIVHLGDLGHLLSESQIGEIGEIDVLLLPVGGVYTIGPKEALEVISQLEPSIVVPMHYRTGKHDSKRFGQLATVEEFLKEGGFEQSRKLDKLVLNKGQMPEEMEVVVLE